MSQALGGAKRRLGDRKTVLVEFEWVRGQTTSALAAQARSGRSRLARHDAQSRTTPNAVLFPSRLHHQPPTRRCRRQPTRGADTRLRMRPKGLVMDQQRENQSPSAKIATSAVQVLHEYTGRGPTKAKTTISETLATVLFGDTLTTGERTLVEHGHADRVLQVRYDYQLTMRDDLIGIVERELDRTVIAFMSQNHIDPDLAIEVFVLEPADAVYRGGTA
jgi:uncharacterized protein YbcI